ncbi:MAG: TIM barrel protein [Candidatus Hydrogenedentales bacterium]
MDRRDFIRSGLALGAGVAVAPLAQQGALAATRHLYQNGASPWPLCLNASTIRPAAVRDKVRAAAAAGYDAMELWMQDLEEWEAQGEKLPTLKRAIEDEGMFVINVIGLWDCMPEGEEAFQQSLELTKKRMEMSAAAGSRHVAVLPLPDRTPFDIAYATDKYRFLLEIGLNEFNIQPAMEFVSVFKGLRRLGQAMAIAVDANHPKACIIPDTFHLYNGGSGFEGLRHVRGEFIASFHWNDVAAGMPPGELKDAERIYPGEGALPLVESLRILYVNNYRGPLSLELFRREHWESDPMLVAKNGIEAMRKNVAAAMAES